MVRGSILKRFEVFLPGFLDFPLLLLFLDSTVASLAGRKPRVPQHIVELQHILFPCLDKVLVAEIACELLTPADIVYDGYHVSYGWPGGRVDGRVFSPNPGLTRADKVQSNFDAVGEVAYLMSTPRRDENCLALGSSASSSFLCTDIT
jgi:hypothetical protein